MIIKEDQDMSTRGENGAPETREGEGGDGCMLGARGLKIYLVSLS